MPAPMRLAHIQAIPKILSRVRTWRDAVGLSSQPSRQQAFLAIIACIQTGRAIPERYYRSKRDRTPDELLEREGVMHLHLGHPGTSELLFLKQYPRHVILLETSDHIHFNTYPIGSVLINMHDKATKEWEAQTDQEAAEQKLGRNLDIRDRLGLKKTESIAIATLMRRYYDSFVL